MRTRTALAITFAAIVAVGALEEPAHAKQATWKRLQFWTIVGDASTPYCSAFSTFKDGTTIHLGLTTNGWILGVQGVAAVPGKSYDVKLSVKGASGIFYGKAIDSNTVAFNGMTPATIATLALTKQLYIDGLGTFNMNGSYQAVMEVMSCYAVLTGRDA